MSFNYLIRVKEDVSIDFIKKIDASTQKTVKVNQADFNQKSTDKVCVLISPQLVLSKQTQIPSTKEEVLRKTIPFALEEELVDDIDDNHFAYTQIESDGYLISIINKGIFQRINELLKANGITAEAIYSEIFCCPAEKENLNVLLMNNKAIVRESMLGSSVSTNSLSTYLQLSKSDSITIYTSDTEYSANNNYQIKTIENLDKFVLTNLQNNLKVNLLQGQFKNEESNSKDAKPYKKLSILLAILIVSWLAATGIRYNQLESKIEEVSLNQLNLINKLVLNLADSEKKNPYAAFNSRLKKIGSNSSLDSDSILSALNSMGQTLQFLKTVKVENLRFRDREIELLVQASSSQDVNEFQRRLQANSKNLRVRTGTRSNNDNGLAAILIIELL